MKRKLDIFFRCEWRTFFRCKWRTGLTRDCGMGLLSFAFPTGPSSRICALSAEPRPAGAVTDETFRFQPVTLQSSRHRSATPRRRRFGLDTAYRRVDGTVGQGFMRRVRSGAFVHAWRIRGSRPCSGHGGRPDSANLLAVRPFRCFPPDCSGNGNGVGRRGESPSG